LKENYDFFPLDRALSLAGMGKDSTETKIDDLLYHVTSIVEKQRREVILRQFSIIRIPYYTLKFLILYNTAVNKN